MKRFLPLILLALAWHPARAQFGFAQDNKPVNVTFPGSCDAQAPSSATATCTASGAGVTGDIVLVFTKAQNTSGTGVATMAALTNCGPWVQYAPVNTNGSGNAFNSTIRGCVLTAGTTPAPSVTWSSVNATNTEIGVLIVHSSAGFGPTILDRGITAVNGSSTSSATGSTNATRNPNTIVIGVSQTLATAETWATAIPGYTRIAGAGSNHQAVFYHQNTTIGIQSMTATLSSAAANEASLIALQLGPNVNCSVQGCTFVQGTNSSGQSGTFDHITLSAVKNGSTLFYFVFHNTSSGSGTTTMSDSTGYNIWCAGDSSSNCSTPGGTVTMTDKQLSATYAMSVFYSKGVITGNGISGSVTGLPQASDCSVACTFIGGFMIEMSGPFKWDSFVSTATLTTSGVGTNNVGCGALSASQPQDMILMGVYNPANSVMSAGTSPITFTLPSITSQVNGQPEYGTWSGVGSTSPKATLVASATPYGAMCMMWQ